MRTPEFLENYFLSPSLSFSPFISHLVVEVQHVLLQAGVRVQVVRSVAGRAAA